MKCESIADFEEIKIKWSKPIKYEKFLEDDSNDEQYVYLYIIIGKYSENPYELFYIGKSYYSFVSDRLKNKDHKERYVEIKKKCPGYKLFISLGFIKLSDRKKITDKLIDEIESILIYANDNEYIFNKNKLYSYNVDNEYKITNKGFKHIPLYKKIYNGIFVKE